MPVGRHAEQAADERDRVRLGEVVEQTEPPMFEARIEEAVHELLRRCPHRLDRPRRERRGDELADARVIRRLDEEQAPAAILEN